MNDKDTELILDIYPFPGDFINYKTSNNKKILSDSESENYIKNFFSSN